MTSALRSAAESLLPAGASVVAEVERDALELARSPSCVHIYFTQDGAAVEARTQAVRLAAREAGWTEVEAEALLGANELRFERSRLKAFVYLRRGEAPGRLPGASQREFADVVMVERR